MLIGLTLGLAFVANAQISSNEVCFYSEVGQDEPYQKTGIDIFRFEYPKLWSVGHNNGTSLRKRLAESEYFYENWPCVKGKSTCYDYVPELSTSKYEVYRNYVYEPETMWFHGIN